MQKCAKTIFIHKNSFQTYKQKVIIDKFYIILNAMLSGNNTVLVLFLAFLLTSVVTWYLLKLSAEDTAFQLKVNKMVSNIKKVPKKKNNELIKSKPIKSKSLYHKTDISKK